MASWTWSVPSPGLLAAFSNYRLAFRDSARAPSFPEVAELFLPIW